MKSITHKLIRIWGGFVVGGATGGVCSGGYPLEPVYGAGVGAGREGLFNAKAARGEGLTHGWVLQQETKRTQG